MGRTKWAFAVSIALIALAMGNSVGLADCVICEDGPAAGFGAPACRGPIFGTEPGCCEHPPTPCDNAWAGFCQEKLKWRQFWHHVGTGYWVPSRATTRPCSTAAPVRQPLFQTTPHAGTVSHRAGPRGAPGPIRLPPTDAAVKSATEAPIPDEGPPPIPEANGGLDVPSEPLNPAPAPPDQSRAWREAVR